MTNDQSKTVIHLAIEHKRFAFVDHLFDWLPPGDDGGGKEQPHSGRAGGGGKDGGGHKESAGATSKHVELARRTAHMAAGAWQASERVKSSVRDMQAAPRDNAAADLLMRAERILLITQDLDGCNPLLLAIQNGQDKMASRILDKALALDKAAKQEMAAASGGSSTGRGSEKPTILVREPSDSVASLVATQKNEKGQAALWAAIESKSELAIKLVTIDPFVKPLLTSSHAPSHHLSPL